MIKRDALQSNVPNNINLLCLGAMYLRLCDDRRPQEQVSRTSGLDPQRSVPMPASSSPISQTAAPQSWAYGGSANVSTCSLSAAASRTAAQVASSRLREQRGRRAGRCCALRQPVSASECTSGRAGPVPAARFAHRHDHRVKHIPPAFNLNHCLLHVPLAWLGPGSGVSRLLIARTNSNEQ